MTLDLVQRRALIETARNPSPRLDYVVTLAGSVTLPKGRVEVRLRYVPDKLIVTPDGLERYLAALATEDWPSLEALAAAVLEDVFDETVARWAGAIVTAPGGGARVEHHSVMLETRQPKWDNKALLGRLERY